METKDIFHDIFLKRLLSSAREKFGLAPGNDRGIQVKIAKAIGTKNATVRQWIKQGIFPGAEHLVNLYKMLNASPNYLLGIDSEEKMRLERMPVPILELADFVAIKEAPLRPEDFVTVPLVSGTIAATIGGGTIVDEHIEDWAIIHKKVIGKKKNLISIHVDDKDGMSMSPILKPGDIVIIDREDRFEIKPKGIYAVRIDDGCTVKRLQFEGKRRLLLIPENKEPAYRTRVIDLQPGQESPVIGRVIWCSKSL